MKKIRNLLFLWCFLFLLVIEGNSTKILSVMAAEIGDEFSITSITRNNNDQYAANSISEVKKYSDEIEGIWITKENIYTGLVDETIKGTISSDISKITCWNSIGTNYTVTLNKDEKTFEAKRAGGQYFTTSTNKYRCYGAYNLYFEIEKQDGSKHIETLIVDDDGTNTMYRPEEKNYDYLFPTSLHMFDIKTAEEIKEGEIDYSSSDSRVIYLDMSGSTVKFQIKKETDKVPDKVKDVNWLTNSANYIVVNGDINNAIRLCATNDRYGEYYSAPVNLKKGYNVIEVYSDCFLAKINNSKAGSSNPAGIAANLSAKRLGTVYIVKSNGTTVERGNDTSLRLFEATAVNPSSYLEYNAVKDEEGNYTLDLPIEYGKNYNGTVSYSKACIGITTTDPGAKYEVLDLTPVGKSLGIYQVFDTKDLTEIKVKVTAADGVTEKVQTVKINRIATEAYLDSVDIEGGTLTKDFDKDTKSYHVEGNGNTLTYHLVASLGSTVTLNGTKLSGEGENKNEYTIKVNPSEYHSILKVVSGDVSKENTYYFHYDDPNNAPLYEIPEPTKELAESMLSGWYSQNEDEMNETTANGYWGTFMAKAADNDLRESIVYDVTTHKMSQATDWAGCIMELVMIGENPYNFNGVNYVEGLKKCKDKNDSYGPYACNIWALEAFKTAGYPVEQSLIDVVKRQALTNGPDFDMRSWAVAAIAEYLNEDEKAQILIDYKNAQLKEGIISENEVGLFYSPYYVGANTSTNGDILMALGQMNVNLEKYFEMDGKNPLTILRDYYMDEKGGFVYNLAGTYEGGYSKDMIIGLADIVHGENVWVRYTLTEDKMKTLCDEAATLAKTTEDAKLKQAIEDALAKATKASYGTADFGSSYYALYDAMAEADPSMRLYGRMCSLKESEKVDSIIADIDKIGELTLESGKTLEAIEADYKSLSSDRVKGYVTNYSTLTKAEEDYKALVDTYIADLEAKIDALGDIDELKLEQKEAVEEVRKLYDALSSDQQKQVKNGNIIPKAENKLVALEVEALIEALPEEITVEQEQQIKDARAAYDALTKEQKRMVLADDVVKLKDAETTLKNVKDGNTAQTVEELIKALGETPTVEQVTAARNAYDSLSDSQKKLIDYDTVTLLKNAEAYIVSQGKELTKVTLDKTSLTLAQDVTAYLKAVVTPDSVADKTVTWSSSEPSVANVDNSGVVTTYKDGTAVITAATKDGAKATCEIKVVSKLQVKATPAAKSVKLTWKKIAGSKGYIVLRYDSKTKKYKTIATLSSSKNSYTVKRINGKSGAALTSGTNYIFQVRSYVTVNGTKVYKKTETVKTATKPGKVTIKKITKKSSKKAKITWKKVKGSTGYQVWMKSSKNGSYKLIKTLKGSGKVSYTKSGLKKKKTYYFKVRAYKTVNGKTIYGAASKVKSIKMK